MVFVISFITTNLLAQGSYFTINTGYGISMSSQNINFLDVDFSNRFTEEESDGSLSTKYEQVNVSLGKGLDIGGTYGYMFNENFGAEITISYLAGSQYEATREYKYGSYYNTEDYTLSSNMLKFNPSVVVAPGFEKFNPYMKFGMIVGVGKILYKTKEDFSGINPSIIETKQEFKGGLAVGLSSGAGVMYNFKENMYLFGELKMINLSYAPTKGETTEYVVNGEDQLSELTTREKKINFVDSYTTNSDETPPDSEPRKALRGKFPYGSLGVNVGVMISL
ncbi:MAG: porin family protein [Bacteroidales bacterium]|nr:porin family protein [Bacteroidales bacterium]MCF8328092.1 porin family protein [Bacteroidales bacterium]